MLSLLEQFKWRRTDLALKQHDMLLRVGMSRQQYQRLESKGNPRLSTLELVAKGLNGELLFIPQEKLDTVLAVLTDDSAASNPLSKDQTNEHARERTGEDASLKPGSLADDPWQGMLGDSE